MTNRWWIYQRERFPIFAHGPMVIAFCVSVLLFSALQQDDVILPGAGQAIGAIVSALLLFFQMRVADEFKDFDIDLRYRPHRPVPSGLVSLHELAVLAFVGAAIQFLIAVTLDVGLVPILVAVWSYLWLMTREFYVPEWLKRHPVAYLLSHMLIMPLIAFYVSAFDWLCSCKDIPAGIGWLLAVSFFAGLVLEIGRKIKAPTNERVGVETYSGLWGAGRSAIVWVGCVGAATLAFVTAIGYLDASADSIGFAVIAVILPALALYTAMPFIRRAHDISDRAIEPVSGVVTLVLYLGLGPLQWLMGV